MTLPRTRAAKDSDPAEPKPVRATNARLRIVLVNDEGCYVGGAAVSVGLIAAELRRRGHLVRVLTADEYPLPDRINSDSFPHVNEASLTRVFFNICNMRASRALRTLRERYRPDIIHVHSIMQHASPLTLRATGDVPTVMTLHDIFIASPIDRLDHGAHEYSGREKRAYLWRKLGIKYPYELVRNAIYRAAIRHVDTFVAPSRFVTQEFRRNQRGEIITIPNGIADSAPTHAPHGNTILFVGRLAEEKGAHLLLEALARVQKRVPTARLIIVGEGSQRAALSRQVRALDLERSVTFAGYVPPNALAPYFAQASVVCIPSVVQESFSLVGLEALQAGRPVVASRLGAIPEWLTDGVEGSLVKPGDVDELAQALTQILRDPAVLRRMSKAAMRTAKNYTITRQVDALEKLYYSLAVADPRG